MKFSDAPRPERLSASGEWVGRGHAIVFDVRSPTFAVPVAQGRREEHQQPDKLLVIAPKSSSGRPAAIFAIRVAQRICREVE